MRRDIASLAARLMAADGIGDYGLAKRKAARHLGAPDSEALPTNQEIEEALRAYQSLYQPDELRERLLRLRRDALEVMRLLDGFNPYLTGPVLDGTAGRYAEAEIELFADSAKDVEIFLLNQGLQFEHMDAGRGGARWTAAEARLRLDDGHASLILTVYPRIAERTHRRNPHTGQVATRASASALAAMLEGR